MTSARPENIREEAVEIHLRGHALLDDPLFNKGSAFSDEERREFGLLGLVPPHVSTTEEQLARTYESYKRKETDLERYIYLVSLQDRNETLFYMTPAGAHHRDDADHLHPGGRRRLQAVQPYISPASRALHCIPAATTRSARF